MSVYNELNSIGRTYDDVLADETYNVWNQAKHDEESGYYYDWKGTPIEEDEWLMVVWFKKSENYVIPHEQTFRQFLETFVTKEENFFDLIDEVDPNREKYWNMNFIKGDEVSGYII